MDFRIDKDRTDELFSYFFIKLQQEDGDIVWTKDSFAFDDILAMDFE